MALIHCSCDRIIRVGDVDMVCRVELSSVEDLKLRNHSACPNRNVIHSGMVSAQQRPVVEVEHEKWIVN